MASSGKSLIKLIVFLAVIAAIGAGAFYYVRNREDTKPPEYTTTTIARGDVIQVITATGQLDALLSVDVGSQISGQIKALYADFNTPVKKGQVLVEIDPATYQQRLRQAQASLTSAQASYRLSEINAKRTDELLAKALVTQQESDTAQAQLQQNLAQLKTNEASVADAEVNLSRCTIYSPIDGIVISKLTEVGKTVAASQNVPILFTIANDLAKMQITAAVAEADIGTVDVNQSVSFTADAFPNRNFRGVVTQVRNAPKTTSNVVTYDTIISVDNKDLKLRPGMTANVSITVARRDGVLRAPNSTLRVRMPDGLVAQKTPAAAPKATTAPAAGNSGDKPAVASAPATDQPRAREGGSGGNGQGGGGRRGGMLGADATPEQRQKMAEIMAEVGYVRGSGPPTTEQREQIRKLMVERGLTPAEASGSGSAVSTRTVYRLPAGNKLATPEAVTVKVGITDGISSEIIDGISEGDVLVTSVTVPGAKPSSATPANPFSGQGQRRF